MASKQELLSSINPGIRLTSDFFKKVYGFEISFPGFSDEALAKLETAGCSLARRYYDDWVATYEKKQADVLKNASAWYRLQCKKEWENRLKGGGGIWAQQPEDLQQMSDSDLITLLENLIGVT